MKLDAALLNVSNIAFDTAPFIYFVERNASYVDLMREVFARLTRGHLRGCSSVITLTEVLVHSLNQNNRKLADEYRALLLNAANFHLYPITPRTAETAAEIRAAYNLRTPDALQLAVAITSNCDAFLCNDNALKRVAEIQILILDELEL